MRQLILDALKAKFTGVSEKILGRIADKLAKTTTSQEQIAAAVEGVTFQQVLDSYGDFRATESQQTAVANYESKHGLKDGKPVAKPEETTVTTAGSGGEEIPAWAKTLIEGQKTLTEQVKTMQGEKLTANRRKQLSEITSSLPESIRKAYDRTPVDGMSDEDFNALISEVTSEVEAINTETRAKGAVFGKPYTGGSTTTKAGGGTSPQLTEDEQNDVASALGLS